MGNPLLHQHRKTVCVCWDGPGKWGSPYLRLRAF
jgi:hypothetical protein